MKNPEEIEQKKLENLERKSKCHSMHITGRLEGTLKNKFVKQVKTQGYKQSELLREVFKFYYDNHPRANSY